MAMFLLLILFQPTTKFFISRNDQDEDRIKSHVKYKTNLL